MGVYLPVFQHPKQGLTRRGELALAVFDHRIEQLSFDERQRAADGGYCCGPTLAIKRKRRAAVFDRFQNPLEFPFDCRALGHAVVVSRGLPGGQETYMLCSSDGVGASAQVTQP